MILLDITDFLRKDDFLMCLRLGLLWPWTSTHFIAAPKCNGCGFIPNLSNYPLHFVSTMNAGQIKVLLNCQFFWCQRCNLAMFDHYPTDGSEYCN